MRAKPRAQRTDGEATRARILEAAGRLFAARGFAEAAAKEIAVQAGVDVALINYHFGSRAGLYQAVLVEAHRRFIRLEELQAIGAESIAPGEKLRLLLERMVERALESDGWYSRVLARELLAPTSHFAVLLETEMQPKLSLVRRLLSEMSGIPEDEPALLRCLVSVAAPTLMLLVVGRDLPGPIQEILKMSAGELTGHLHGFSVAGLEAVGRAHRQQEKAKDQRRP